MILEKYPIKLLIIIKLFFATIYEYFFGYIYLFNNLNIPDGLRLANISMLISGVTDTRYLESLVKSTPVFINKLKNKVRKNKKPFTTNT